MSKSILWVISPFFLFLSGCPGDQSRPDPPPPSQYDCAPKIVSDGKCFYNLPNAPNGQIFDRTFTEDLAVRTQGITVGKGQWECYNGFSGDPLISMSVFFVHLVVVLKTVETAWMVLSGPFESLIRERKWWRQN